MSVSMSSEVGVDRAIRVDVAVKAEFAGDTFLVHEMTSNLSVGGMFLRTAHSVAPRSCGTLTFRLGQGTGAFTLAGEVVHVISSEQASEDRPAGVGIQFVDLSAEDRRRLERWVDGVREGSGTMVQDIRRTARESGGDLLRELRKRPTSHKVMFAVAAQPGEIEALIRDSNPTVLKRLMDNPNLSPSAVRLLLQNKRVSPTVLTALARSGRLPSDEETLAQFCVHPAAPIPDVLATLPRLSRTRVTALSRNTTLRAPILHRVKQLAAPGAPLRSR